MREKLEHIKIRHKIIIIFLGLLILTTIFTLGISWHGSQKDAERQMREMSDQTLNALDNSLQLIVKQVEQGSYTIFWNPVVQDILSQIGGREPDPAECGNLLTIRRTYIIIAEGMRNGPAVRDGKRKGEAIWRY